MRFLVLVGLLTVACKFDPPGVSTEDSTPDAAPPPATADVRFVSVTADISELYPGLYGFEVETVLRNELDVEITDVAASLTFSDGTDNRSSDFRWRDLDMREGVANGQPATLAAGEEATYTFKVDALASAIPPGPIIVNGSAAFTASGTALSATPDEQPLQLAFAAMNAAIVVNSVTDELDDDSDICFREALVAARTAPGLDRIVFDPSAFPPGSQTISVLDEQRGPLPILDGTGGDIVIDGSDADFHLAVDSNWESPDGRYGLHITSGNVVVHKIGFHNMGYNYLNEGDLSGDNCGGGDQLEGGAIRVDGGTLVVDSNYFADPDVAERNCYAASIRLEGGSGHRILRNRWTDSSMDSLFIDARTVEVTDNVMDSGSSTDKTDECIYVDGQGGGDLWIVGNLCVDQEYSGVIARGADNGTLYVVNNTFVRNGLQSLSAVRREQGQRAVVLRNNLYVANNPSAVRVDNNGDGFDLAYEAIAGNPLCASSCQNATVDQGSILNPPDLQLADSSGTSRAAFTPATDSPLVDSGLDWLDRNGARPGHYSGQGPERGAVELP